MKGHRLFFIVVILFPILLTLGCDAAMEVGSAIVQTQPTSSVLTPTKVLDLINQYRMSKEVAPLAWDAKLAEFAQWRANDMITRGYFSHQDPVSGKTLVQGIGTELPGGENLFQVQGSEVHANPNTESAVLTGWQNSPSHNAFMLWGYIHRGGVAFAQTPTRIVCVFVGQW